MSKSSDPTSVPLLDLRAQFEPIEQEIREAIDRVLESQRFILGPEVEGLESEVADYCQCDFGIGVSSGTDALVIALMAMDLQPGDEVITTPYTFFATAGSIVRLGAKPVFVDINPETYNIDASQIEAHVTPRTRAVIPVHLYGQMAEMDPIMDVANSHSLYVIEDAAQAIGSEYHGKRAGSIGHMGCFSFFPSKNLGAFGDGGMVTTCDAQVADRLKLLRNHGYRPKYHNKVVGGNFRLDALQAAILRVKLKYLDQWTSSRQQNAAHYREIFTDSRLVERGLVVLADRSPLSTDSRHICNQFVIRVDRSSRDKLINHLKQARIGCEIYYPVPLHLQECFADLGYQRGDMTQSESAAEETLALPNYPELMEAQQVAVVRAIADFFESTTRTESPPELTTQD